MGGCGGVRVAIPLRGYVVCNQIRGVKRLVGMKSQSPYGAMWFATKRWDLARRGTLPCRNPLTGLCGLQLYPPKNAVLDDTARGGVCEKDEAWNMHGANNGGFRGFVPMNTRRREGR